MYTDRKKHFTLAAFAVFLILTGISRASDPPSVRLTCLVQIHVDGKTTPLSGVSVKLVSTTLKVNEFLSGKSGDDGSFTVDVKKGVTYHCEVRPFNDSRYIGEATAVVDETSAKVIINAQPAYEVSAVLKHHVTGQTLAGVDIAIDEKDGEGSRMMACKKSDAKGRVSFVAIARKGDYEVYAYDHDWTPVKKVKVSVPQPADDLPVITAEPSRHVRCAFVDSKEGVKPVDITGAFGVLQPDGSWAYGDIEKGMATLPPFKKGRYEAFIRNADSLFYIIGNTIIVEDDGVARAVVGRRQSVNVLVLDETDGKPIADVELASVHQRNQSFTRTDADGKGTLLFDPGKDSLSVKANGYESINIVLDVTPIINLVTVKLNPIRRISGTLIGVPKVPDGASVEVFAKGFGYIPVRMDGNEHFNLSSRLNKLVFVAAAPGYAPTVEDVDVEKLNQKGLVLTLEKGLEVNIKADLVADRSGIILTDDALGLPVWKLELKHDQADVVAHLHPGRYKVFYVFVGKNKQPTASEVLLQEAGEIEVDAKHLGPFKTSPAGEKMPIEKLLNRSVRSK